MDTKSRVHFLDSLRGFTLLHMVLFHLCYDLVFFIGLDIPWYTELPGDVWGCFIRSSFILISGIVFRFGRHPLKRGLVLMGWGCVLTLVTWIAVPEALIRFGILSFLGAASILGAITYPYLKRIPAFCGILVCAALFAFTRIVPNRELPELFYKTHWLYWLGLPHETFYSTDYFPLLPWIFLFFIGIFLGESFQKKGVFSWMERWKPGVLAFLGRHSLCIYLLHQPIIYGLCLLAARMINEQVH